MKKKGDELGPGAVCQRIGLEGREVEAFPIGLGPHLLGIMRICRDRYAPGHTQIDLRRALVRTWLHEGITL